MKLPFDRRAWPGAILILIASIPLMCYFRVWPVYAGAALGLAAHLLFFRDFPRRVPAGNGVVSPGSCRVVDVSEVYEDRYLQENAVKVGIFLSIFDAHINCAPLSGIIGYQHYVMGKFLNALNPESVNYNECNWIGIESGEKKVLVRQISGAIARRIHWDVKPKDAIRRSDKFGIICYGSRVECYLPVRYYNVACKIGDYVRTGVSVIAEEKA